MGYYINPPDRTKEQFLSQFGYPVSETDVRNHDFGSNFLPVCLVDNNLFTAAGIAFDQGEANAFLWPDGRKKKWFKVHRSDLKPYYP